jgi:hypothetical protein
MIDHKVKTADLRHLTIKNVDNTAEILDLLGEDPA